MGGALGAGGNRPPRSYLTWALAAVTVVLAVVSVLGWSRSQPRPVNRLSKRFADGEELAPRYGPSLLLSPDGQRLVYVGPGEPWFVDRFQPVRR